MNTRWRLRNGLYLSYPSPLPCPPTWKPVCLVLGVLRLTWFAPCHQLGLEQTKFFSFRTTWEAQKNLIPLEGLGLGKEEQVSQTINIYFLNHLTFLVIHLMGMPVYETLSGREDILALSLIGAQALRSVTLASLSATKLTVCGGGITPPGHFQNGFEWFLFFLFVANRESIGETHNSHLHVNVSALEHKSSPEKWKELTGLRLSRASLRSHLSNTDYLNC